MQTASASAVENDLWFGFLTASILNISSAMFTPPSFGVVEKRVLSERTQFMFVSRAMGLRSAPASGLHLWGNEDGDIGHRPDAVDSPIYSGSLRERNVTRVSTESIAGNAPIALKHDDWIIYRKLSLLASG